MLKKPDMGKWKEAEILSLWSQRVRQQFEGVLRAQNSKIKKSHCFPGRTLEEDRQRGRVRLSMNSNGTPETGTSGQFLKSQNGNTQRRTDVLTRWRWLQGFHLLDLVPPEHSLHTRWTKKMSTGLWKFTDGFFSNTEINKIWLYRLSYSMIHWGCCELFILDCLHSLLTH